jgi:hypothetical protein
VLEQRGDRRGHGGGGSADARGDRRRIRAPHLAACRIRLGDGAGAGVVQARGRMAFTGRRQGAKPEPQLSQPIDVAFDERRPLGGVEVLTRARAGQPLRAGEPVREVADVVRKRGDEQSRPAHRRRSAHRSSLTRAIFPDRWGGRYLVRRR